MITNKVDFIATIEVRNANPNGDPLAGNMPRTDSHGFGLISDVAIKRKIRNRMQDQGYEIFVKSRDRSDDKFTSLQKRFENVFTDKDSDEKIEKETNEKWLDVRTFGQVITYHKKSIGIRGPVSISMAKSLSTVTPITLQITRSSNSMEA
jgi:Cas7 group CRISPR-associated protein Csh2